MLGDVYFLQPLWLIGLIAPLLWLIFFKQKKLQIPQLLQQIRVRYPALDLVDLEKQENASPALFLWSKFAVISFVSFLLCSLAEPVLDGKPLPAKLQAEQVDLILIINTSISMVLKDYQVDEKQIDRMAMTRLLLKKLVSEFRGRKVGLVILGRPSSVLLPLTDDFLLVQHFIDRLKTTLGGRNSDISETLSLVQKQFELVDIEKANASQKRIVMLVSDGYEQLGTSSPESAVKKLILDGFELHTLAIGTEIKPDFSLGKGTLIYQPVDLALMTRLAKIGEGQMVHAKKLQVIEKVIDNVSIDLPGKQFKLDKAVVIPLYHYPLTMALILLMVMLLPFRLSWTDRI